MLISYRYRFSFYYRYHPNPHVFLMVRGSYEEEIISIDISALAPKYINHRICGYLISCRYFPYRNHHGTVIGAQIFDCGVEYIDYKIWDGTLYSV